MKENKLTTVQNLIKGNHRFIIVAIVCLVVSSTAGCATHNRPHFPPATPEEIFDQAAAIIEKHYIDKSGNAIKLDTSKRPGINSLMSQLDTSTHLMSWREFVEYSNPFSASIGIDVRIKNGEAVVRRAVENSPAYQADLGPGDKLAEIDGVPVKGLSSARLSSKLRGIPGSEVAVKYITPSGNTRHVTLTRRVLDWGPAVSGRLMENKLGYIRIARIERKTPAEVKSTVKSLGKSGMQGLVIDLRGNSGGSLYAAVETAQLFLDRGTTIALLLGRNAEIDKTFNAQGGSHFTKFPVAILMDSYTAAGAEILAAALQENRHSVLIGERTSGDGEIRSVYSLKDGSVFFLRTHYLQTPAGKSIEGRGIMPDVEVVASDEEKERVFRVIDSHSSAGRENSQPDLQLKTALAELQKRMASSKLAIK